MPAHTPTLKIAAIAASIKEWGWTTPALVGEDGGLIAGHARVLAARQLGILELGELKLGGFDLSLTGFGDLELQGLMADRTAGLTDPDDVPVPPEHPVSQTGDLWLLGAKVRCPKCHKATALERAIKR